MKEKRSGGDMDEQAMRERIANLEFQNDQLTTELEYVDQLLKSVGFTDGLASVKAAAQELAEYDNQQDRRFEDGLPDDPPGLDE
jgi:hypothetical protein